jgi:hypothetical protein
MKIGWLLIATTTILVLLADTAIASEAEFLKSLDGKWAGQGTVRLDIESSPINVVCHLDSRASETALSMAGRCRGLVIISGPVGADLKFNGENYTGSYLRPTGGRAGLAGNRSGNAINLTIRWPNVVNGDRNADLTLQKLSENGMRLVTVDVDPATGDKVVISDIQLRRN